MATGTHYIEFWWATEPVRMLWSFTLLIRAKDFLFGRLTRRLEDNIKMELKSL
jgi:hypothetical protein